MTGCGMWLFGVDLGSMANEDTIILWDAQGWGQEPGVLTPPWECLAGEGNSPTLQNWAPLWRVPLFLYLLAQLAPCFLPPKR